ncbi:glycosyltransferase family 2 protein [Pedobacter sp. SD-b]|uniref:Glycosyltransferase family 2 protein n=1 Tax=Pedobacter segetis TaxID=2793069 RepID=A0ABS1BFT6_9SPHI|nr:glycosyltransferase family 2 protein [Pedobacter segetis]MBK0381717.1 glycosyltransferase family 2 protein [Pedobacter segetis]
MDLVSIITVNFNQPEATCQLLLSIKKHYDQSVEIIVVDNASDENYESEFKKIIPDLTFIRSKVNLGFAGGNNLGISFAKGDFIFLLNNDTEIPKGCIETLVAELIEDAQIGLLSPLILYDDDRTIIQYAGYTPLNYLTARNKQIGQYQKNLGQFDGVTGKTAFCHGAAVICRREFLDRAGLMDENYFLYYEELDWCEKFKRIGKTINFTGKTEIYHKESITVGKDSAIKIYFMARNRMLFIRKNTSVLNTVFFTIYYLLIACPKMILGLRNKGRKDLIKWVLKGLVWNFTHQKESKSLGFKIN